MFSRNTMLRISPIILLCLFSFADRLAFAAELLPIGMVQGSAETSPYVGQTVSIEGVVTGHLMQTSSSGSVNWLLFLQDGGDNDLLTSDGIAVYVGREEPTDQIGDVLRVTGEVAEFYGLTELTGRELVIEKIGNGELPEATPIEKTDDLERVEGMVVSFAGEVITPAECAFTLQNNGRTQDVLPVRDDNCDSPAVLAANSQVSGPLTYNFEKYKIVQQDQRPIALAAEPTTESTRAAAPGALLITEVYYHSTGLDQDEEWLELTNVSDGVLDISGYKIGDEETRGGREGFFRFSAETVIEPGRSIVIAQSALDFQRVWGFLPNYELRDSSPTVPDLPVVDALGSSTLALANDGDEVLLLDTENRVIDALSYGDSSAFFASGITPVGPGESLERIPAACDTDTRFDFKPQRNPTPASAIFEGDCGLLKEETLTVVGNGGMNIGRIQGNSDISPFVNREVSFNAVVTAIHEDQNASGTIFYTIYTQDPPGNEDGDPTTSDAIPVFTGRSRPDASIGDLITVSGQVIEYFGMTEIADKGVQIARLSRGNQLPTPIEINPPSETDSLLNYYEPLEGMRVHLGFSPARVVGPTYDGCGLAVVRQEYNIERPFRRQLTDPIGAVIPILADSDVNCPDLPAVKFGDEISGLQGVLTYNFEQYKIIADRSAELTIDEAPLHQLPSALADDTEVPVAKSGEQFSVISLNVENLFDSVDDTGDDSEPKLSEEEINTKLTKLAHLAAYGAGCPTIIALQEVENAALVNRLDDRMNAYCTDYKTVHLDSVDRRGIDLAFLVSSRVEVISAELQQTCTRINTTISDPSITCPDSEQPLFSRPPFALEIIIDGQPLTLINNHFKSKRGGETETQPRRIEQARFVAQLVTDYLAAGRQYVMVIGDMNDYENSEPMRTLEQSGLVNIMQQVPAAEGYTFVFSGMSQLIDGMLVTPQLAQLLSEVTILHTNADYPDEWGSDLSEDRLIFKATDHDIPLAVFDLTPAPHAAEPDLTAAPTGQIKLVTVPLESDDNTWLVAGAIGLMLVAGVAGFVFGRKRN